MRKIVAGLFMSLDGVVQAPETWHYQYFNDEIGAALGMQMAGFDTLLLGRGTYDEFFPAFSNAGPENPFAGAMNNIEKVVVSTTLDKAEWQNTTLISDNVFEQIAKLKEQPGKGILINGSPTLVQSLLKEGLLDQLDLLIDPVIVSRGKRLFDAQFDQTALQLTDSKTYSNGVVSLSYQPQAS